MRKALFIFAVVLAVEGWWVLSAALFRTDVKTPPVGPQQIAQAKAMEFRASEAARIGRVRGDLWAESVYTRTYLTSRDAGQSTGLDESKARTATLEDCDRALSLAPIMPGLWALCALLDESGPRSPRAERFLEMSYYTGLNVPSAIPVRLSAAARLDMRANDTLQDFVGHDIVLVLTQLRDLKPSILTAYRDTIPENRALFTRYAEQNDPALAAELAAIKSSPN